MRRVPDGGALVSRGVRLPLGFGCPPPRAGAALGWGCDPGLRVLGRQSFDVTGREGGW